MKDRGETINEEGIKENHKQSVKYLNGTAANRADFEVTHLVGTNDHNVCCKKYGGPYCRNQHGQKI